MYIKYMPLTMMPYMIEDMMEILVIGFILFYYWRRCYGIVKKYELQHYLHSDI